MSETWTEGWLPDGTHFHVDRDPYAGTGQLRINGKPVELSGQHPVRRRRDGGTTVINTTQGRFVAHRQIGREAFDEWNGVRLLSLEGFLRNDDSPRNVPVVGGTESGD